MPFDPVLNGPWPGAGRPISVIGPRGVAVTALLDLPETPAETLVPVLVPPVFGRPKEDLGPIVEALISTSHFCALRPALHDSGDEAPGLLNDMVLSGAEISWWGRFLREPAFLSLCRQVHPGIRLASKAACVAMSMGATLAYQAQAESGVFDAMALLSFMPDYREFASTKFNNDYYDYVVKIWRYRLRSCPQLCRCFAAVAAHRAETAADEESRRRYRLLHDVLAEPERASLRDFDAVLEGVPFNGYKGVAGSVRGLWGNAYDLEANVARSGAISAPLTFVTGGADDFFTQECFDEFIVRARGASSAPRRVLRLTDADHMLHPPQNFERAMSYVVESLGHDLAMGEIGGIRLSLSRLSLRRFHEVRGVALRHAAKMGVPPDLACKMMLPSKELTPLLRRLLALPEEVAQYIRLLGLSARLRGDGTTIIDDLSPARLARLMSKALSPELYESVAAGMASAVDHVSALFSPALSEGLDPAHLEGILHAFAANLDALESFLQNVDPGLLEQLGKRRALAQAQRAAERVPAYKELLHDEGLTGIPGTLEQYPVTGKANYVLRFSLDSRCFNGRLPGCGTLDESSGSSGRPTNWLKGQAEEDRLSRYARFMHRYLFGESTSEQPTILVSAFSQGGWGTSTRMSVLGRHAALVKNVGTDIERVLDTFVEFGPGYHYLLAGYPPFLREVVRAGCRRPDFHWRRYRLDVVHGGEGYTSAWRRFMSQMLPPQTRLVSSYGASDLDIGIAVETPLALDLRELLDRSAQVRRVLTGEERMPVFVGQYNPVEYYLEQRVHPDGRKSIAATVTNPLSPQPRVRYDVGDEGGLLRFDEVGRCLQAAGIAFDTRGALHLPFLYLYGRLDGTLSFDGANVYPTQVEEALLSDPSLAALVRSFQLRRIESDYGEVRLGIDLECFEMVQNRGDELAERACRTILGHLLRANADFRESYSASTGYLEPVVRLLPPGALGLEERIKHRYVA